MKRREVITLLGAATALWSLSTRAQQPAMPVIGYLSARSPEDTAHLVDAFRRGLREAGFVEGQNVTVEYRWAFGQHDRLPGLAADLVHKPVAVLVSTGGESAALAAKAATSTIPIAFIIGGDPVKLGLAATYSQPGGNATGISIMTSTLEPKRLELLRELVPQASTIGVFLDPNFPPYEEQLGDLREAARALDLQVQELRVGTDAEIEQAFETVARQHIAAVMVVAGPFFDTRRDKLVTLATRYAVPAMYHFREFTAAGGLACGLLRALRDEHRTAGRQHYWAVSRSFRVERQAPAIPQGDHARDVSSRRRVGNPDINTSQIRELERVARSVAMRIRAVDVKNASDLDGAFDTAKNWRADALIVLSNPLSSSYRARIGDLAAKAGLPTIYLYRAHVDAGGLISYGPDLPDMFRRCGGYVGRLLGGAKPADLPIERPARFELVVNLKTAKALGITIPEIVLVRADAVIE